MCRKEGEYMQPLTEDVLQAIANLKLPKRFESKLQHDIRYLLNKCLSCILEIRVFGSCASGKYMASSDIDILVITEDKLEDRALRGEIQEALDQPIEGVSTDVVFYTLSSYMEAEDVFSRELRRSSYLLWKRGKDI